MNAGKLIAQIAAFAIIIYCSYSAVISAVPLDANDLQHPLDGLDEMTVGTSLVDGNLNVTINGEVKSNLPQDIVGVKIAFFIGKGDTKITLAQSDVGTIKSKTPTPINEAASIPICTILSYSVCSIDSSGHMSLPIRTQLEFKYFEWQGSYLIDLGITVNMDYETDVPAPTYSSGENNSVTMAVTLDGDSDDLVATIASHLDDGTYVFECGDATITIEKSTVGSDPKIEFTASGNATDNASEILKDYLEANGNITFTYDGHDYVIDKDNAESFISILNTLYGKVA